MDLLRENLYTALEAGPVHSYENHCIKPKLILKQVISLGV